jgi:resuscitation-promoting factor RpfB
LRDTHVELANEMRLYHSRYLILVASLLIAIISGCSAPSVTQAVINVHLTADGQTIPVTLAPGSTVQQAISAANIQLGSLDRVDPPLYSLLEDNEAVQVVRVAEKFEVEEEEIPFEQLRQPTELLPEGQLQMDPVQKGEPGLKQTTYRILYEDGEEVSRSYFNSEILKQPVPQIVLVGVLPLTTQFQIPGKLAYLFNGDAWIMEGKTSNRRPVITSADLDGRVFVLSPDGNYLLFTRRSSEADQINELWVADLSKDPVKEINLQVKNIVQFADWVPNSNSKIVFSTVEPRSAPPGWQANNDLYALSFSPSGWVSKWQEKPVLEANSGGIYGWWGPSFAWSPSGDQLAYTRPDSIGLLDFTTGVLTSTLNILPFQTGGDWAWVPGIGWGPDGDVIYTVNHTAEEGASSPEQSPNFDLVALPQKAGNPLTLVRQTGMFGYPVASPVQSDLEGGDDYQLAYLQAIFPTQSDSSRYRLATMDRDGSNRKILYPAEDKPGLEPQQVAWSPAVLPDRGSYSIAVLNQGNLWLVDSSTGEATQVTGDGLISRVSWR